MITNQTTLAELSAHLDELANPFVTAMLAADGRYSVIAYSPAVGSFDGQGETIVIALARALDRLSKALDQAHTVCANCSRVRADHIGYEDPVCDLFEPVRVQ